MVQKIIGITGTQGSGKGTVVSILEKKDFKHFSVSDKLVEEIKNRGMEVNRDSMRVVADDLRKSNFPGYNVYILLREALDSEEDCIIESIRCPSEVDVLRNESKSKFFLLSVDADIRIRFDRIKQRAGSKDNIDFEKFKGQEDNEMANEEPWKMNIRRCIELSDHMIDNNGSLKELEKKVNDFLDAFES